MLSVVVEGGGQSRLDCERDLLCLSHTLCMPVYCGSMSVWAMMCFFYVGVNCVVEVISVFRTSCR